MTTHTRIIFSSESDSMADYELAAKEIDAFLEKFSNSAYLTTAVVHQEFRGYEVTGEVRLSFKPDVYASTQLKVARQVDKGIQEILEKDKYRTIKGLVHYFVVVANLDEHFYRRYRYLALKEGKFYMLPMVTETKVLPLDSTAAEEIILGGVGEGGNSHE